MQPSLRLYWKGTFHSLHGEETDKSIWCHINAVYPTKAKTHNTN